MVQRNTIDAIRERADLVEVVSQVVTLKRKGTTHLGLCPFHQEKSPSFNVVPHKGIYHCFGCGEGGDVFKFLMKTRGVSFMEAVTELGARYGIAVEEKPLSVEDQRRQRAKATLYDVCQEASSYFHQTLLTRAEGAEARAYLEKRGMSAATIERFRLGFAPDSWDSLLNHLHRQGISPEEASSAGLAKAREKGPGFYSLFRGRIIVPILDPRGRVVAFGGRVLVGDGPKYINSPETDIYKKSNTLFGLSHARNTIQRNERAVVVEGYFDVMSLHQAGFEEAVAACGTSLTDEHLHVLKPLARTIVALFDGDAAGERAARRSIERFLEAGIEPRRLSLGGAKDPDELIQTQGAEAFARALAASEPLFNHLLRAASQRAGTSPGARQGVLEELAPLIRKQDIAVRASSITEVARELSLTEALVYDFLQRNPEAPRPAPAPVAPAAPRWQGTRELNHLLWLLLHFPTQVIPVFAEMNPDPEAVSDRVAALKAIALLVGGLPLPEVIDQLSDPDLPRILRQAAALDNLYAEAQAAPAARQILSGMAVRRLDEALSRVGREIAACQQGDAGTSYIDLFRRRQELQQKKQAYLTFSGNREGRAG